MSDNSTTSPNKCDGNLVFETVSSLKKCIEDAYERGYQAGRQEGINEFKKLNAEALDIVKHETVSQIINNITSMKKPFYHKYIEYFTPKEESAPANHIGEFIFPNLRRAKLYITDKLDKSYSSILYGLLIAYDTKLDEDYNFNKSYLKIGDESKILEILEKLKNMSDTEAITKEIAQDL